MRKKIIMIGDSVYPDTMGGSHRHIYDVSKRLADIGYQVLVFSPKNDNVFLDKEIINGVEIRRYPRKKGHLGSCLDFLIQPYILFKKIMKSETIPDVVHGHWPLTCFFIWLYVHLKHLPVKLVYTFHGPVVEEYAYELRNSKITRFIFLKFVYLVEFIVLHYSDKISTASNYMKNKAISLYGNAKKISVNYLAIDEEKFDIVPSLQYPACFDKQKYKYIFTLRRLKKRMGIQLLLKAFAIVLQKKGDGYKLLIGGKGDYKNELEKLTRKLNIEKNVLFLGFLADEELKCYYSASDACVVPSLDLEGFGLTTVEAMACGVPVVATNVCANKEILANVNSSFLTEQNPNSMAMAIIKAMEQNVDKRSLRTSILQRFNWNKTINGYLDLYR